MQFSKDFMLYLPPEKDRERFSTCWIRQLDSEDLEIIHIFSVGQAACITVSIKSEIETLEDLKYTCVGRGEIEI